MFHNLGSLEVTVDRVVAGCADNLRENLNTALDIQAITQQQSASVKGNALINVKPQGVTRQTHRTLTLKYSYRQYLQSTALFSVKESPWSETHCQNQKDLITFELRGGPPEISH